MKLTQLQHEILVGTLLGDACAQWNTTRTKARISFRQKDKAYLEHLCECFSEYITAKPIQNKSTGVWQCDTRQFAVFRFYRQQFYTETGLKIVPKLIHRWLTPRAIAYWYMDDGALKWQYRSSGVRFCTDCFTHKEVKQLAATLTQLYGVQTSTYRQRGTLRIYINGRGNNAIQFGQLLLPYIQPSMMYKVPSHWHQFQESTLQN